MSKPVWHRHYPEELDNIFRHNKEGVQMESVQSKQEQAFNEVTETFMRLIERDGRIEHKKEVLAFYNDLFEHPGVRNNMLQAFSNFLWHLDANQDAKAVGALQDFLDLIPKIADPENENTQKIMQHLRTLIEEETNTDSEDVSVDEDLSEVGGGDEDNTPLL